MTPIAFASSRIAPTLLAAIPVLPLFAPWQLFPVTSFHQEWLAIAAGLLACLCAWPALFKAQHLAIPVIVWLPLALAVFILLQTLMLPGLIVQHAGMAVAYLLWAALLMAAVGLLQQQIGRARLSLWLAGGLLAAAVWAAARECAARPWNEEGIWGGTGQPNLYGDLLALGGVSLLYLRSRFGLRWWLFAALGLSIALGLSLSPSRSVWLYWLAVAVVAGRYQPSWLKPLAAGLGVYLLLQAVWTLELLPGPQITAAERVAEQTGGGSSPRWYIWTAALELFRRHPLLGHGFGEFDWAYYQAGYYIFELPTRMEHAHNIVLHFMVELGMLPVLALLGAVAFWLRGLLAKNANQPVSDAVSAESEPPDADMLAWMLMLAAVLTIHSLLEYPLWHAHFLGIAAWLLAIGERRFWHMPLTKPASALFGGLVSLALAVAVAHEWQYTRMELALLNAMAKQTPQREQALIDICQQIPDTAPLLKPYIPVAFTLTGHPENPAMREQLAVLAEAAARFTPTSSLVYRLALMQALTDDKVNARQTIDKALTAYPADAIKFTEELLRIQAHAGPRIDVLMARLLPVVNPQLQANLPAGLKAKVKQAISQ
ncbi:Wzy polymerase domain-containing protein [Methylomonas sp. SURF-2]|uniref:Wzy polymerase domain-containing protein n=1 Tax=Methylomonas subterranea TaxID=2952225 RepID=A0ABT1TDW7_9GAMM|nr:O-antigen ligase family protein [Methylomonas sp. SURF-2]MCQ8103307.1 Wzy polymerase domain-containing protein [Methylomonas sp. SURF-2]